MFPLITNKATMTAQPLSLESLNNFAKDNVRKIHAFWKLLTKICPVLEGLKPSCLLPPPGAHLWAGGEKKKKKPEWLLGATNNKQQSSQLTARSYGRVTRRGKRKKKNTTFELKWDLRLWGDSGLMRNVECRLGPFSRDELGGVLRCSRGQCWKQGFHRRGERDILLLKLTTIAVWLIFYLHD